MKQSLRITIFIFLSCITCTSCLQDKSMKKNEPHNIRGVWSYKKVFNDLNDIQLTAAHKYGINPISTREQAEKMKKKLKEIKTCDLYVVDDMTHSIPFLVPGAYNLLGTIGQNFLDSLNNKGLNPYLVIVTSVLRTKEDVQKLRKHNGNASENSAHFFATTFDVSWKRFKQVRDKHGRPMQKVDSDTLKMVLSEVLRDLQKQNACYIKYELKQGCFHITTRQ